MYFQFVGLDVLRYAIREIFDFLWFGTPVV